MIFPKLGSSYVYLIVLIVDLLGFMGGSLLTWTSPVLPKLNTTTDANPLGRPITTAETSWIGSFAYFGGSIGPLFLAYFYDYFGRKPGFILVITPAITSCVLSAFAKTVELFYAARFLAGVAIASGFSLGAMYVGEITPKKKRGFTLTSFTGFIVLGQLYSYIIGPYTSIKVFNLLLCIPPVVSLIGILMFVPESPYLLVHQNRVDDALASLQLIRGTNSSSVNKELEDIVEETSRVREDGIIDIFKSKANIKAFYIVTGLVVLQLFTGISVILTYTQTIFEQAGTQNSELSSILVGLAQLTTTIITTFIVDKSGRKPLLHVSVVGIILSLLSIGAYFYLNDHNPDATVHIKWLPLVSLFGFFAFYNIGIGSLPWAILGEIYPLNIKSAGSAATTSVYWALGFLFNYFYQRLVDNDTGIGAGPTFWLFAALSSLSFVFVHFFVVETKGKTLQEIQDILAL